MKFYYFIDQVWEICVSSCHVLERDALKTVEEWKYGCIFLNLP